MYFVKAYFVFNPQICQNTLLKRILKILKYVGLFFVIISINLKYAIVIVVTNTSKYAYIKVIHFFVGDLFKNVT